MLITELGVEFAYCFLSCHPAEERGKDQCYLLCLYYDIPGSKRIAIYYVAGAVMTWFFLLLYSMAGLGLLSEKDNG
jgi:hypothetical protein